MLSQANGHRCGSPSLADGIWKTSRLGRHGSGRLRVDEKIKALRRVRPQPFHLPMPRTSILGGLAARVGTRRSPCDSGQNELKPAGGIVRVGFDELRWPGQCSPRRVQLE
jgi:hypothetical protein